MKNVILQSNFTFIQYIIFFLFCNVLSKGTKYHQEELYKDKDHNILLTIEYMRKCTYMYSINGYGNSSLIFVLVST